MKLSPTTSPPLARLLPSVLAVVLLWTAIAHANGNYSHVWVATDSLQYLPDGDLKDLLQRGDHVRILRNGAMYPDGGYAVNDGYGEISHWEPFQRSYLDWIRTTYAPPWSPEAEEHIAFLMGMATHGMSDQLYDSMYLSRHQHFDENGDSATSLGVDAATDVCFAATQGQLEKPEAWVPAEVLAPLYETSQGHQVDAKTIEQGHNLVFFAIVHANVEAADPAIVADYMEIYPWGCGHQNDLGAPGSPPTHGPAVASYWQVLWDRLHGDEAFDKPLLATYFTGGTPWDQPVDASTPDSWVSFVMPQGLDPATFSTDNVAVANEAGDAHPIKLHVYYGHNSHVVNVKPQEDWAADTRYTVAVSPPLTAWDGRAYEGSASFFFATMPEPAVAETGEVGEPGVPEPSASDVVSSDPETDILAADTGSDSSDATNSKDTGACSLPGHHAAPSLLPIFLCLLAITALRLH